MWNRWSILACLPHLKHLVRLHVHPGFESHPVFDYIRNVAFTWSMTNLVIHNSVYMIITGSRILIVCLKVCLDFSATMRWFRNLDMVFTWHSILISIGILQVISRFLKTGIRSYPSFLNQNKLCTCAKWIPGYSKTPNHNQWILVCM